MEDSDPFKGISPLGYVNTQQGERMKIRVDKPKTPTIEDVHIADLKPGNVFRYDACHFMLTDLEPLSAVRLTSGAVEQFHSEEMVAKRNDVCLTTIA